MPTLASKHPDEPLLFQIRFRGTLNAHWFSTLQNVTLSTTRTGNAIETTLAGEAPDEAALIGLINMLYQLGCTLITVESRAAGAPLNPQDIPGA